MSTEQICTSSQFGSLVPSSSFYNLNNQPMRSLVYRTYLNIKPIGSRTFSSTQTPEQPTNEKPCLQITSEGQAKDKHCPLQTLQQPEQYTTEKPCHLQPLQQPLNNQPMRSLAAFSTFNQLKKSLATSRTFRHFKKNHQMLSNLRKTTKFEAL